MLWCSILDGIKLFWIVDQILNWIYILLLLLLPFATNMFDNWILLYEYVLFFSSLFFANFFNNSYKCNNNSIVLHQLLAENVIRAICNTACDTFTIMCVEAYKNSINIKDSRISYNFLESNKEKKSYLPIFVLASFLICLITYSGWYFNNLNTEKSSSENNLADFEEKDI